MIERCLIRAPGGSVPLHIARPPAGPRAGLVVVHEAFGVTAHIEDLLARFAAEGYLAVAPSLFHRFDRQVLNYDEIGRAKELIGTINVSQAMADVEVAQRWLAGADGVRDGAVAVIGYCFGGRISFLAAMLLDGWSAAVSYYGGGIADGSPDAPIGRVAELRPPMLAVFGGRDVLIPMDQVTQIADALQLQSPDNEVLVYDEAGHGFFCDARPAMFDADAAADAWSKTLAFLDRYAR